jgi:hypothetical protein
MPNSFYGGFLGNVAGNPFGSDFVIPQQRQQVPGGPRMAPLQQPPTRVFPPDQPGRKGAIDVRSAMGTPGMNIGNVATMSAASNPFAGPGEHFTRYAQALTNMQNKDKVDNVPQQPAETEEPLLSGTVNPFGRYIQAMTNMQQTKQAGFNRKTVS